MDASSASWTRIPRDYHEQQRLQLEHRLFASSARSNSEISDDHSSFNLEDDEHDDQLNGDMDGRRSPQLQYSSSEFSMEYPRNPQVELANADDYSLSNPMHRQPREGDTRSTFAHHASGITFRTGLRGTRDSRNRDFSAGALSDMSIDYDPDRPLDALLRRASDLSILQDSPRDAPRSEFTTRAQGLAKQMMAGDNRSSHQSHSHSAKNNNNNGSFGGANTTLKPTHKSLAELARAANTPLKFALHTAAPATTRLFPAYGGASGRIQLPDVTGITSAVATPLKGDTSFRRVPDLKPSSTFASRLYRQSQPTASTSNKPASASTSKPITTSKPTTSTKEPAPAANPAAVLDTLTHRLHQIERESLTSRRRVNELERELDMCKSVVDIERSRMGELSVRHAHASANASAGPRRRSRSAKDIGELDAAALNASFRETQMRYREAVGEEKELEALVKALHAHLRLTSTTVESHKQLINELRAEAAQTRAHQRHPSSSAPSSSTALPPAAAQIWDEVERVKAEVEVLWGDVGRLRGVVEGGLGLRRAREGGVIARDGKEVISGSVIRDEDLSDLGRDGGSDDETEYHQHQREEEQHQRERGRGQQQQQHQYSDEEEGREEQQEDFLQEERREWGVPVLSAVLEEDEPASTRASLRSPLIPTTNVHTATAHHPPATNSSGRFIQDEELERVRAEVEERRSLRSMSMSGSEKSTAGGALRSNALNRVLDGGGNAAGGRVSPVPARVASSSSASRAPTGTRYGLQQHTPPRPLTPDSEGEVQRRTEARRHVKQPSERARQSDSDRPVRQRVASPLSSPALPQIRGERLERLFYAAPEHNSRTCGVCHRRRRAGQTKAGSNSSSVPPVPTPVFVGAGVSIGVGEDGEIKFCEGDERRIAEIAVQSGVPPQTVLARVLRELEDDFTHYKSIYVELADQYKAMDAASDMGKRNLLANHLREVIDVLEQKGDQIASLYDLLHFEDRPLASSSRHHKLHKHDHTHSRQTRLS